MEKQPPGINSDGLVIGPSERRSQGPSATDHIKSRRAGQLSQPFLSTSNVHASPVYNNQPYLNISGSGIISTVPVGGREDRQGHGIREEPSCNMLKEWNKGGQGRDLGQPGPILYNGGSLSSTPAAGRMTERAGDRLMQPYKDYLSVDAGPNTSYGVACQPRNDHGHKMQSNRDQTSKLSTEESVEDFSKQYLSAVQNLLQQSQGVLSTAPNPLMSERKMRNGNSREETSLNGTSGVKDMLHSDTVKNDRKVFNTSSACRATDNSVGASAHTASIERSMDITPRRYLTRTEHLLFSDPLSKEELESGCATDWTRGVRTGDQDTPARWESERGKKTSRQLPSVLSSHLADRGGSESVGAGQGVGLTTPQRSRIPKSISQPGSRSTSPSPLSSYITNRALPSADRGSTTPHKRRLPFTPTPRISSHLTHSTNSTPSSTRVIGQPASITPSSTRVIGQSASVTPSSTRHIRRPASATPSSDHMINRHSRNYSLQINSPAAPGGTRKSQVVAAVKYGRGDGLTGQNMSRKEEIVPGRELKGREERVGVRRRPVQSEGHSRDVSPGDMSAREAPGSDDSSSLVGSSRSGGGRYGRSRIPVSVGHSREVSPSSRVPQEASKSRARFDQITPGGQGMRKSRIPRSTGHSCDTSPGRPIEGIRNRKPGGSMVGERKVSTSKGGLGKGRGESDGSYKIQLLGSQLLQADMEAALSSAILEKVGKRRVRGDGGTCEETGSETSSVSSGSYSSSSRATALAEQQQQQLCGSDVTAAGCTPDVTLMLRYLSSQSWSERREGLLLLHTLVKSTTSLKSTEVKRITEVFTRMFHDPNSKVFNTFLETLVDFLPVYSASLSAWLYTCMSRLFLKMGAELLGSVIAKVEAALDSVRESFAYEEQIVVLAKLMNEPTYINNMKIRLSLLEHLHEMTHEMEPCEFVNCDSTRQVAQRVVMWTTEQRHSDVRKCAEAVVVAFFNLNSPEFSNVLSLLPRGMQDTATRILHEHMFSVSHAGESHSTNDRYDDEDDDNGSCDDVLSVEDYCNSLKKASEDIESLNRLAL